MRPLIYERLAKQLGSSRTRPQHELNALTVWTVHAGKFVFEVSRGTNKLPQIYAATKDGATTEGVSGLVTWPMAVAEGAGEKDGETTLSRVVSHGVE